MIDESGRIFAHEDLRIVYDRVGSGPPLLLLHGFPQDRYACRGLVERLKADFTLVVPDLPGYGESRFTQGEPGAPIDNSKRRIADAVRRLMASLGYDDFYLAGHDRGGRVGFRLAMDRPEGVRAYAALDIIPTIDVWEAMDARAAIGSFHWPLMARPYPIPDRMILAAPDVFIGHLLDSWAGGPEVFDAATRRRYIDRYRDPAVVYASCEDYRAGADADWTHDAEDRRAGRRLSCPTMMIWNSRFIRAERRKLEATWSAWCAQPPKIVELDCGHFVMEEMPDAAATAIATFFRDASSAS